MSEAKEKNKYMHLIHFVIMALIPVVFGFLPAPAPITSYGMKVLGVFVGLIYGWTFIDLLIPSLYGAIALALVGYGTVDQVFLAMFNNSTVLLMLFGVSCFAALEQSGAGDWMVSKLLGSKMAKKSPVMVLEIFFFIFWIAQQTGLGWFVYFALLPLMGKMFLKCGYPKGDKFIALFMCGCLMMIQVSMSLFAIRGWGLMTAGTATALTGVVVSNNEYMLLTILFSLLLAATYPFFMKLVGCDFSKLATVDINEAFGEALTSDGKLNQRQTLALASICVFVVILTVASLFSSVPILSWINTKIGCLGLMVLLWVFVVLWKVDGKPILDMRKAAGSFPWDMLMLIAIALLVSNALTATETGVSAFIGGLLGPIFAGLHPLVFLLTIGAVTIIMTNFTNNIACCFIMLNIVCSMYNNGFPVNVTAAAFVISITSVFIAYLTPAASMPGALMHANEANTPATLYKVVPLQMIYGFIMLAILIVPYVLITG